MNLSLATFYSRCSLLVIGTLGLYLWMAALAPGAQAACQLREDESVEQLILPLRLEVRHDHRHYFLDLLQLALDKTTEDHGPCTAVLADEAKPQARLYQDLTHKQGAHIIDATAGPERDQRFRAIKFPLLKGLMGYRVAFIRPEDQAAFAAVEDINDLRDFTAGQGEGWLDVDVLRLNGIEVTTTRSNDSLYRMLRAGRFDFFPRGAQEVLSEAKSFDTKGLAIEQNLIIAYPWPVYFYVHKDHNLLAERVETGLMRARKDGDFDTFFNTHPLSRDVFAELKLDQRRTIYLCNPIHSDRQLLARHDAWIKPWPPQTLCTWQEPSTSGVAQ